MPDIIEENEAEGGSAIQRRAHAAVLARVRVAAMAPDANAARVAANNNNAPVAANPPAAVPPVAAAANPAGGEANATAEVGQVAVHLARLANVDVRSMFRRLGVRRIDDIKFIREKDLDGIPRITPIQKRKTWAVLKYVATNNALTAQTTLTNIRETLTASKKKDSSTSTALTTTTSTSQTLVPMVQVSKLEPFDGSHSNWVLWKNKSKYALAQTNLGPLLREGPDAVNHAKQNPGQDHLLFNLFAEALIGGSAKHLIGKAEQQAEEAATNNKKSNPSGRILWHLLQEEYSQGPMAFWILSDARQTLQNLTLVGSQNTELVPTNHNDNHHQFVAHSAHDYVNRFRSAKETLAEYKQALPDPFLASTFVEHVYDERLETIKKQLLHDISTKNLFLEDCIKELLMSNHMLRAREQNRNKKKKSRKRNQPEEPEQDEDGKRLRLEEGSQHNEGLNGEPDEAIS